MWSITSEFIVYENHGYTLSLRQSAHECCATRGCSEGIGPASPSVSDALVITQRNVVSTELGRIEFPTCSNLRGRGAWGLSMDGLILTILLHQWRNTKEYYSGHYLHFPQDSERSQKAWSVWDSKGQLWPSSKILHFAERSGRRDGPTPFGNSRWTYYP